MAQNILLLLSPTFRAKAIRTLERSGLVVEALDDSCGFTLGGADHVVAVLREKGYAGKLNRGIVYEDRAKHYHVYRYFHGDAELQKQIDALRADPEKTEYLGLNCLLHDHPDIQTWQDVEDKLQALAPPQLESAESPETPQEPMTRTGTLRRRFDLLADAIKDIAEVEDHIYRSVEETHETLIDLQKRLTIAEQENQSLKQQLDIHAQRLAEIEDMLTADPTQLAAIRMSAQLLKQAIAIELPQRTVTGEYWKKAHSIVYRKNFNRFLRDKGLQPHEKDAMIAAVEQIMVNPFAKSLETEVRWNGDNGEMIPGIENKETYYYTHATHPYLRIRWIIRNEEGRIHFIDAFRKTTNQA